ncbi:MAG TPA: hypothetical protein VLC10_03240 [Patescibacteria group bacterium]|nr:hypothetical protein [Patescibacteria group bacterium]
MANRIIVMRTGQKVAFAIADKSREHVLYAGREEGGIVFRMKGAPLSRIAGKGMADRIAAVRPSSRRDTYALELLREGDTVQITTPAEDQVTCVYLEACRDGIALVGGASLVARIEGDGLSRIVDSDDSR